MSINSTYYLAFHVPPERVFDDEFKDLTETFDRIFREQEHAIVSPSSISSREVLGWVSVSELESSQFEKVLFQKFKDILEEKAYMNPHFTQVSSREGR